MSDCEKYKALLMGLIDSELTSDESSELNSHFNKCKACREEYEELRETSAKISMVSFEEPTDAILKKLWKSPYSRWTRNSGLFLVFAGWLVLVFYGLIEIIRDSTEPAFPRIAVAAVIIGFFTLLFTVIRERFHTYKTDRYREVER